MFRRRNNVEVSRPLVLTIFCVFQRPRQPQLQPPLLLRHHPPQLKHHQCLNLYQRKVKLQ